MFRELLKYSLVGLIVLLVVFFAIRFLSDEDSWLCENGQWVKHGFPSSPQPETSCRKPIITGTVKEEARAFKVALYFSNSKFDPDALSCEETYVVERVITLTENKYKQTLRELLGGLTESEKNAGYFTSINQKVKINSLDFNNGTIRVDFSEELGKNVGGSCRVSAIRSQIENTLKQFTEVKEVVISIEGNSEEALQP